uniref:Uncharacterized protein n=1 Tax=Gouania willdenowi TaxID=441366 RepID=A0A8C5GJS2_GOUWI
IFSYPYPHTARVVTDFLSQKNLATLPRPASSPDMSFVGHLWDILDRARIQIGHVPVI